MRYHPTTHTNIKVLRGTTATPSPSPPLSGAAAVAAGPSAKDQAASKDNLEHLSIVFNLLVSIIDHMIRYFRDSTFWRHSISFKTSRLSSQLITQRIEPDGPRRRQREERDEGQVHPVGGDHEAAADLEAAHGLGRPGVLQHGEAAAPGPRKMELSGGRLSKVWCTFMNHDGTFSKTCLRLRSHGASCFDIWSGRTAPSTTIRRRNEGLGKRHKKTLSTSTQCNLVPFTSIQPTVCVTWTKNPYNFRSVQTKRRIIIVKSKPLSCYLISLCIT